MFNIHTILPITSGSSKRFYSLSFPHQNPVRTFPVLRTFYMPLPCQSSLFDRQNNIDEGESMIGMWQTLSHSYGWSISCNFFLNFLKGDIWSSQYWQCMENTKQHGDWWFNRRCRYSKIHQAKRMKWLRHVQRKDQAIRARKLLEWKPMGIRPVGRPRQRRQEDVVEDFKKTESENLEGNS